MGAAGYLIGVCVYLDVLSFFFGWRRDYKKYWKLADVYDNCYILSLSIACE